MDSLHTDDLGPFKVVRIQNRTLGLRGVLVLDVLAAGPAIGGLRLTTQGGITECARLARAMTLKNAMAGLPHGGGKSLIHADPHCPTEEKERLIRAFACALKDETGYIFGPDMGTDEICMGWVKDEIGRAVGLPSELGGLALDRIGATAHGLCHAIDVSLTDMGRDLRSCRFAVQGFGAVGRHLAILMHRRGAVLVAAADSGGTIQARDGLDPEALCRAKAEHGTITAAHPAAALPSEAVLEVECDILVPAARPDAITKANADRIRAWLVAEGANIAVTAEAEDRLRERDVTVLPDFVVNAGGVICAAMEYRGASRRAALDAIADTVRDNTMTILRTAARGGMSPRAAATATALARVRTAMATRRWGGW